MSGVSSEQYSFSGFNGLPPPGCSPSVKPVTVDMPAAGVLNKVTGAGAGETFRETVGDDPAVESAHDE